MIWYGDDLVESWRGTAGGGPCPACEGIPNIWGRHFGSPWLAQAYGIAGPLISCLSLAKSKCRCELLFGRAALATRAATSSVFMLRPVA